MTCKVNQFTGLRECCSIDPSSGKVTCDGESTPLDPGTGHVATPLRIKIFVILVVLAAIMAIPMVMLFQLDMGGPEWYWATTGNIFTDWAIYYLNILPLWIIFAAIWLSSPDASISYLGFKFAKWIVIFYLVYWLAYDWAWWGITYFATGTFDWNQVFYFTIIIPDTPMWFFFVISILGGIFGYLATRINRPLEVIPFIIWLVYIYLLGGIEEVIDVDITGHVVYSCLFIPAIIITFIISTRSRDDLKNR